MIRSGPETSSFMIARYCGIIDPSLEIKISACENTPNLLGNLLSFHLANRMYLLTFLALFLITNSTSQIFLKVTKNIYTC